MVSHGHVSLDHERVVARRGERSGATAIVAIHSTRLGPALGGVRIWSYHDDAEGLHDAIRLSAGMTLKAAAAGLELGGGKGVICMPEGGFADAEARRDALLDFGDLVESLGGDYVTAEDVGASPEDLVTIAERTSHVTGLPADRGGSGDPSPLTALGVERAIEACLEERFGSPDPAGRRIAIVGLGHVGGALAGLLAERGADLAVSDIADASRERAGELGAAWLDPATATESECDVLAPCALGGVVDHASVHRLHCGAICGSANNQLADDSMAAELERRGILYAPDFLVNSGGLINVAREIHGYGAAEALGMVEAIGDSTRRVLARARSESITPLDAARDLASARLGEPERPAADATLPRLVA
ncbi:Glu/Leu/Phe/Val dehydrogenase [Thermoleophilia bacterium SCSIO 60948]|nr:Glu/Leu/Phe/Val dehydrogenase [Thermoleophilia bacterium SCSIO 60948]